MITPPDDGISPPDVPRTSLESGTTPAIIGDDEPPHPSRRRRPGWSFMAENRRELLIAIIAGGVAFGIGDAIRSQSGTQFNIGVVGLVIALTWIGWHSRRLRWWVVPNLVLAWLAMSVVAVVASVFPGQFVAYGLRLDVGDCRGWQNLEPRLAPISITMQALSSQVNSTEYPSSNDLQRWADMSESAREQYELLDHPPALSEYVDLSIDMLTSYEQGFHTMAIGGTDSRYGQTALERGDTLLPQAQAAFRQAAAQCTGSMPTP